MCFVSRVHGTLVLTQALASDYVCLKYSISQRAGRNKQNTHQEIVLQKLKSVGGSPRWSSESAWKLNKEPRSFIKQFKSNKNSRIWLQFNKQLEGIGESKACTMLYIALYETFQVICGMLQVSPRHTVYLSVLVHVNLVWLTSCIRTNNLRFFAPTKY